MHPWAGAGTVAVAVALLPMASCSPVAHSLYIHFHKAGGTSACTAIHAAGHNTGGGSCNCFHSIHGFRPLVNSGNATAVARAMDARRVDVCAIEHGAAWPTPEVFRNKLKPLWNGTFATMLRDPWSRFKSAYMRVYQIEHSNGHTLNIEKFASAKGDHLQNVKEWGCFNRPNYYVRFLNGIGNCDEHGLMTDNHLQNAKTVLEAFDHVFVTESNATATEMADYLNAPNPIKMPPQSNSKFSKYGGNDRHNAPPTQHFMANFYTTNKLDYQLYMWTLTRHNLSAEYTPALYLSS